MCPLLHGVRRAALHPNTVQLGFPALVRGIMGGSGEREGLFLRMTACVFVWPTPCVCQVQSQCWIIFLDVSLLNNFEVHFYKGIHIFKRTQLFFLFACECVCMYCFLSRGHPLRGHCVYIGSIVTMCVHSSGYFLGNDLTNRSTADLISIFSAAALDDKVSQLNIWRSR